MPTLGRWTNGPMFYQLRFVSFSGHVTPCISNSLGGLTPPKVSQLAPENDGWKMSFPFGPPYIFRGKLVKLLNFQGAAIRTSLTHPPPFSFLPSPSPPFVAVKTRLPSPRRQLSKARPWRWSKSRRLGRGIFPMEKQREKYPSPI